MPWTANDAETHTHKATTSELKELWAKVANESLERNGDEGRAVREANAVVARQIRSVNASAAGMFDLRTSVDLSDFVSVRFWHLADIAVLERHVCF
jgi:hypothetical protein